MRTESIAAAAYTAGTRLWRALLAGLAVVTLASCGGGGDDAEAGLSPNFGWVRIDETSADPSRLTENVFVSLDGMAFLGTKTVSWVNVTTGESGQAYDWESEFVDCFIYFCLSEYIHEWHAEIPLVTGANVIQVTASDGAGDFGTESITITRLPGVPPTITSTSPADGATVVAVNSVVTVVFSEVVDGSTIRRSTVRLEDSFGNWVPADVSSSGRNATLDPFSMLMPSTTYRAIITTEVRDLSGNALATPYTWTFTTRAN